MCNIRILMNWCRIENWFQVKACEWCDVHCRCRHTKPLFCTQLLSFHVPSWYISTQFSLPKSPSWTASLGSPGAQLVKPRDVRSVQPHPTTITIISTWSAYLIQHLQLMHNNERQINSSVAYMSDLWSGRSKHSGTWCNWYSWWIPPQLDCELRLIRPHSPLGRSVSPLATRNPLFRYMQNSSDVRTSTSLANTSHHPEPASPEAFLQRESRQTFVVDLKSLTLVCQHLFSALPLVILQI